MEVIFALCMGLFFCLRSNKMTSAEEGLEECVAVSEERTTMLNPTYYDDPDAFMRIAHVLGF